MRNFSWLFLPVTIMASTLFCMDKQEQQQIQQAANAGHFGNLPEHVIHEIATYCSPLDHYAMRLTGKHLNNNLQSMAQHEKTSLQEERKNSLLRLRLTIGEHVRAIRSRTTAIKIICQLGDFSIAAIACFIIVRKGDSIIATTKENLSAILSVKDSLSALLIEAISSMMPGIMMLPFALLFAKKMSPFRISLLRPVSYCCNLAAYLNKRKSIIKQAQRCIFTKKDCQMSCKLINNDIISNNIINDDYQSFVNGYKQDLLKTFREKLKYLISPSATAIAINNIKRTAQWIHHDIYESIYPIQSRSPLPIKHDE